MSKFLFVLTRGPEDPTRAVRCFQFAKIAADKGHEVTVFLVDDAAVQKIRTGVGGRNRGPDSGIKGGPCWANQADTCCS